MDARRAPTLLLASALLAILCVPSRCGADSLKARAEVASVQTGLRQFYAGDFGHAQNSFEIATDIDANDTFALSFLNAAAAHRRDEFERLVERERVAVLSAPKSYLARVRLGFTHLFAARETSDDLGIARGEFSTAIDIAPARAAAHLGLGILRFETGHANAAKSEFLRVLAIRPRDILAREYLAILYQSELRDPQRALSYCIGIPNDVPGYADIQYRIGSILRDLAQPEGALEFLRAGIALDGAHVSEASFRGYTMMARIEIERKHPAEAQKILRAAIASGIDALGARVLLAALVRVQGGAATSARETHR